MVGLATAWHLQERGVEVTVLDRSGVAAGASWGNAGWLTPGMAMPLSDPSLWTYGPKALVDPAAPLHVPARMDPQLWQFLARFALHATQKAWDRTMAALTPIDRMALESFDELTDNGVESWTRKGPSSSASRTRRRAGILSTSLPQWRRPASRSADPPGRRPDEGAPAVRRRLDGVRAGRTAVP